MNVKSSKRGRGAPLQGEAPKERFSTRIDADLLDAARRMALDQHRTLVDVLESALRLYVYP